VIFGYGFAHPASGRTHWLLLPSMNCNIMQIALESFARECINKDTIIVMLWDRAGFHQTVNMKIPEGIEFFPLPPYTPAPFGHSSFSQVVAYSS
jgi:hypothetical protein